MQGRYLLWSHKVPWHFFSPVSVNVHSLWTMTTSFNKQRGLLGAAFLMISCRERGSAQPIAANTTWRCRFPACAEARLQAVKSYLRAPRQLRAWEDLPAVSLQRAAISAASTFSIGCLFVCLLTHVEQINAFTQPFWFPEWIQMFCPVPRP